MGLARGCVSTWTCVFRTKVGGARLMAHRNEAGCVSTRRWPNLWGLRTGDGAQRVVIHERAAFREVKNESQDLKLQLGAGARGSGVPGCVQGMDFSLEATCPSPPPVGSPGPLLSQMRFSLLPGREAG